VLRLLARGLTNPQLARELHISVGTVKLHLKRIFRKLGISGRTQAALRAVELESLRVGRQTSQ
jgi:DNA-binding NarL/FixJ family response regulator